MIVDSDLVVSEVWPGNGFLTTKDTKSTKKKSKDGRSASAPIKIVSNKLRFVMGSLRLTHPTSL